MEYVSLQKVPYLEDALLRRYQEGRTRTEHHLHLASLIFVRTLGDTARALPPDWVAAPATHPALQSVRAAALWKTLPRPDDHFSCALWLRVNGAHLLRPDFEDTPTNAARLSDYINGHLRCVVHYDETGQVDDYLYEPPGPSQYPDDARFITTAEVVAHERKPSAMAMVKAAFPQLLTDAWDMANALDPLTIDAQLAAAVYHPLRATATSLATHSLYYACVLLIDFYNCAEQDATLAPELRDALYHCRVAYVDLFYYCLAEAPVPRMDNVYLLTAHEDEPRLLGRAPYEL